MTDTMKETSVSVPNLTTDQCEDTQTSSERSVPNLSSSSSSTNAESSAVSLLETFAAVAFPL